MPGAVRDGQELKRNPNPGQADASTEAKKDTSRASVRRRAAAELGDVDEGALAAARKVI